MEAIILAGGLGTRLRSVVEDIPKSMALINSRPFLEYQFDHLIERGISRFILSIGYKSQFIENHFSSSYKNCEIVYAKEETQLGTGGAIKNAIKYAKNEHIVVVNGDSLFKSNIQKQYKFHIDNLADITLAVKPMKDFDRYGTIEIDKDGKIENFREKQYIREGFINAGVYIINVNSFLKIEFPEKFSIEKEVFENNKIGLNLYGYICNAYFLDIGIPEDFYKAQYEVSIFPRIDKSWTLFLDRDGVINKKLDNDYVKSIEEFVFMPNAIEAIVDLSNFFGRIIVVTNQQGVGKGIMTEDDLERIHKFLLEKVRKKGGIIDAIYYAPQLAIVNSNMRKPNIGMAKQAKKDFPEIDFNKSIMIGDSESDLEFGKRAKMTSILINKDKSKEEYLSISSLEEFSKLLSQILISD